MTIPFAITSDADRRGRRKKSSCADIRRLLFCGESPRRKYRKAAGRQIDGLGVHQIAFEENFDPVAVLGNGENDAGGVFDRRDQLLPVAVCSAMARSVNRQQSLRRESFFRMTCAAAIAYDDLVRHFEIGEIGAQKRQ